MSFIRNPLPARLLQKSTSLLLKIYCSMSYLKCVISCSEMSDNICDTFTRPPPQSSVTVVMSTALYTIKTIALEIVPETLDISTSDLIPSL